MLQRIVAAMAACGLLMIGAAAGWLAVAYGWRWWTLKDQSDPYHEAVVLFGSQLLSMGQACVLTAAASVLLLAGGIVCLTAALRDGRNAE